MTTATFTHLEVHSHFTLLAATPSVAALAARASAEGMSHLALTDTNALYGVVSFAQACRAHSVTPIIGMTLRIRDTADGASWLHDYPPDQDKLPAKPGHLILLATGPAGYRSLCRLSSLVQGRPDRIAIDAQGLAWDDLLANRQGLLCLSGGRMGQVERHLRAGDLSAAQRYAGKLALAFGDSAYLAMEIHSAADEVVAAEIETLGQRLGLPTVAVQPVYALAPQEAPRLRLLAAIRENRLLEDDPAEPEGCAPGIRPDESHWLTESEISERFALHPAAVGRAGEVATRCGEALPDGRPIWPALVLPEERTPDDVLANRASAGLTSRYGPQPPAGARDRLRHEIDGISRHSVAPLFLIVADIVRYAREQDIPVSTRGSVANSLVAYCMGITTVDPILHGLLFERFLNPARSSPPDIDLDFCSRRRDQVLDYVRSTYGAERVALVGAVSTMRPQSAVRETGKAYGLSASEIDRLVAMLPRSWHPDPNRREQRTAEDVLAGIADERLREVVRDAYGLVGQPDHLSVHPGGVVIAPGSLTDVVPVQWAPKGFLITQFEHGDVEAIGLPKTDLLGIRALTVLADATEIVQAGADPGFSLDAIPMDDPDTGDLLEHSQTIGVFQCESDGAQRTLRKLKARTVQDLAVANAFFKPGPARGGMADAFVRRYRGWETVSYLHPALAPILGPTRGVLIFQEQVLRIATEIAGLSWAQADEIRSGMSHFGADRMLAVREQFVKGCLRQPPGGPGLTASQADALWGQIMPFAGYGFNQGHATAYAEVSYRSAYLKAHYPAEFLCARLANYGGFHHPAIYAAESARLGHAVRPPHVNASKEAFTLVQEAAGAYVMYMGLGQVRDLRRSTIAAIIATRARSPFTDLRDLLARVELQPKELDHLIRSGALDGLAANRASLLAEADQIGLAGAAQLAFDFDQPAVEAETPARRMAWEHELLGFPVSVHPLSLVAHRASGDTPLRRLPDAPGAPATAAGVRLPGWIGGPGFYLGNGETFVLTRPARGVNHPPAWQPVLVRGRWLVDKWDSGWLQADAITPIAAP